MGLSSKTINKTDERFPNDFRYYRSDSIATNVEKSPYAFRVISLNQTYYHFLTVFLTDASDSVEIGPSGVSYTIVHIFVKIA